MDLRAGDGLAVGADLRDRDAGNTLLALNVHNGVAELERNAEVVQTLDNIALQTAGIRQQLRYNQHLRALKRHAPRHNEANVAAAENDDSAAGHEALHVDEPLRCTGGINARRAVAGDVQRAAASFPAAHGQDDRACVDLDQSFLAVDRRNMLICADGQYHRVEFIFDLAFKRLRDVTRSVFRAGQLFAEGVQAEAVVDALVQNAAQLHVALKDQDALAACVICRDSRRQTGGAAADDDNVIFHLSCTSSSLSLFVPTISRDAPPHLVISL